MKQFPEMHKTVLASLVLSNSITTHGLPAVKKCLNSLLSQKGFRVNDNLFVRVTDNASDDRALDLLTDDFSGMVEWIANRRNIGFCGGHNQAVKAFLDAGMDFFLILNPDLLLKEDALLELVKGLEKYPQAGMATPRLYRADKNLNPIDPLLLDAAGMYITPDLRHFDQGSGEPDSQEFNADRFVFGGTGACLLIRRECAEDLILDAGADIEADLSRVYPQLEKDRQDRRQLFDEAFFAYREDADLAWRAQLFGWR